MFVVWESNVMDIVETKVQLLMKEAKQDSALQFRRDVSRGVNVMSLSHDRLVTQNLFWNG